MGLAGNTTAEKIWNFFKIKWAVRLRDSRTNGELVCGKWVEPAEFAEQL